MSSLDENSIVLRHLIRQYFTASKSSESMNSALGKKNPKHKGFHTSQTAVEELTAAK